MIKNITIYLCVLLCAFGFNIFYYAWFSWFLLVAVLCLPILSLAVSLPFMINTALNGFVVFAKDTVAPDEDFFIGIAPKKKPAPLCPVFKIKLTTDNAFSGKRDVLKILYGGTFSKAVFTKCNRLTKNCGCVRLCAKYCKVYDFTGIFFIPVKVCAQIKVNVISKPKKPSVLPNYENVAVLGYKPKIGGGFSDFYELREYQNGDSIKSIHWKLSSKYDNLIVREPSQPIYRKLAIRLIFCDDNDKNDDIIARFRYAVRVIVSGGRDCCVMCNRADFTALLYSEYDAKKYLESLYTGVPYKAYSPDKSKLVIYNIFDSGEEVSSP